MYKIGNRFEDASTCVNEQKGNYSAVPSTVPRISRGPCKHVRSPIIIINVDTTDYYLNKILSKDKLLSALY